eukprot:TRINITY_DN57623_c0_g1_i1.p1 TRINITY_DN57623_c0_g1~~TRINITY_DN57623_c0_g1_i1.p1  ORF type:complete len:248 (-),score=45.41 TRINITY_DN57623_c0_g1_i1:30-728(-)
MVRQVSYFVDEAFNSETYESCKNVQFPAMGDTIMGLLCGPWGSAGCTPQKWWTYLGTESNGYSPFEIIYEYGDKNSVSVDGFNYHSNEIDACANAPSYADKAGYSGCKCADCPDACAKSDVPDLELYDTDILIWHFDSGDMKVFAWYLFGFIAIIFVGQQLRCIGDYFIQMITKFFTLWGKIAAQYPKTVIIISVLIASGLSIGMVKLEVTTDPIELWASPQSRSRIEKDFF